MVSITFISGLTTWLTVITVLISLPVSVTSVGFNEVCSEPNSTCDTGKSLECVTLGETEQCKCTENLYHHGDTCTTNAIDNLKVTNPAATPVANSQTQLVVNWTLPADSDSINKIEVSTNPVTTTNTVVKPFTTQTTLNGLQAGTTYTISIKSIDTTSRATEQSTYVTTRGTTNAVKRFDDSCSSTLKCDESKNLECNLQSKCKCKQNHYYDGNTKSCSSTLDNLKVRSPNAVADSQTQVTVSWTSPIASTAVNTIEVSWTPGHGESQPKPISSSSTGTIITGLQGETDYTITITSKDTTSGSTTMLQFVTVNVQTNAVKRFDESCSSTLKCDESKNLECNLQSKCKCKQNHYYDGNTKSCSVHLSKFFKCR